MYIKISMVELQPNKDGKNDVLIRQIQAISSEGKYIKAIKLNQGLVDKIKGSPILIDQEDPTLLSILD